MFGQIDFEEGHRWRLLHTRIARLNRHHGHHVLPEDIALSSAVWIVEGTEITFAFLIAFGVLAAAYVTNRVGQGNGNV